MGMSDYVARLRACVGHDLLVLPSAAACIRDERGRILLLRRGDGDIADGDIADGDIADGDIRRDGLWSMPGGALDPGERLDQAVVREVREETGLEVEPVAVIGVYSDPENIHTYPNGDRVQPITTFFECRVVGGALQPDMDEILGARYFGPEDELPRLMRCCLIKARDAFAYRGQAFYR
jgi:8-oxo-dGTP pyrophosphatase MutT (NUDIX family)